MLRSLFFIISLFCLSTSLHHLKLPTSFPTCIDEALNCQRPGFQGCKFADSYGGTKATTINGKECQKWSEMTPHEHRYSEELGDQNNFCRNPDGCSNGPWCLTRDPNTRWEPCFNTCKTQCINEEQQCFRSEMMWACSLADGYAGNRSRTISGKECQKWSSQKPHQHPFSELGDNNYCRNPDGKPLPWCHTSYSYKPFEYCFFQCSVCPEIKAQQFPNGTFWYTTANREQGSFVVFQCNDNFEFIGRPALSCLSLGFWDSEVPKCVQLCSALVIENAVMTYGASVLRPDVNVSIICKDGFYLSGADSVLCDDKGQWMTDAWLGMPLCLPICPDISPSFRNGNVSYSSPNREQGSTYQVSCDENYILVGTWTAECLPTGRWAQVPVCEKLGTLNFVKEERKFLA